MVDAKKDLEKEIETWKALKEQYSQSNVSVKAVDEGEIDDTENAQDSVSEDDSDDDSDRKGTLRYITLCYIYNKAKYLHTSFFLEKKSA